MTAEAVTTPTAPSSGPTWLEELAAAERAATAAPWTVQANEQISHGCRCLSCWEPVLGEWLVRADNDHEAERDARLIAALRNAAPRLIAAAEERDFFQAKADFRHGEAHRMEARIKELEGVVREYIAAHDAYMAAESFEDEEAASRRCEAGRDALRAALAGGGE